MHARLHVASGAPRGAGRCRDVSAPCSRFSFWRNLARSTDLLGYTKGTRHQEIPKPTVMPLSAHPPRTPLKVHPHVHSVFWLAVWLAIAVILVYMALFAVFVAQHGQAQRTGRDGRLARLIGRRTYLQHMRLIFFLSSWRRLAKWLAAPIQVPEEALSKGMVVLVGDSPLVQQWSSLSEDFDPLSIGRHPFDNSHTSPPGRLWSSDWLQTLVSAEPAAIVYSAGDADISAGAAPQSVLSNFREFVQAFRAAATTPTQNNVPIVFLSVLVSPYQRAIGPSRLLRICAANSGPWGWAKTTENILCVDLNQCSFAATPRYFLLDGFYVNRGGQRQLVTALRPLLTAVAAGNVPKPRGHKLCPAAPSVGGRWAIRDPRKAVRFDAFSTIPWNVVDGPEKDD